LALQVKKPDLADLEQCPAEPERLKCLHISENIESMRPGMALDGIAGSKARAAEIMRLDAQNPAGLLKIIELNGRTLQVLAHSRSAFDP
jgi:hypothetical protein